MSRLITIVYPVLFKIQRVMSPLCTPISIVTLMFRLMMLPMPLILLTIFSLNIIKEHYYATETSETPR